MRTPANDKYEIEPLSYSDIDFVKEIVFQAIYVHPGTPAPTRDILRSANLQKYYRHWGQKGDTGLLVIHHPSERPVGGAFVRYYKKDQAGYGFVSEQIPELNIALLPDHRGKGIGTLLLRQLIDTLQEQGCKGISLSVDKRNPAFQLYQKLGFRTVRLTANPTMLLTFE